jgi:hypothetical protein
MNCLRSGVSANFLAASVAAIASGVIGLAMMFSKLVSDVFSRRPGRDHTLRSSAKRKKF